MSTFVRKDFYIEPPTDANPEAWEKWMRAESLKARADKAAFNRRHPQVYSLDDMPESGTAKVRGVWRQAARIGLSGSDEDIRREPIVEATQEDEIDYQETYHRRGGGVRKGRAKLRREQRREQKRERYGR